MFASFYEKLNSTENCYKKYKKFMKSKLPNWTKPAKISNNISQKEPPLGLY